MTPETEIRHLVDKVFSLQWCRENLVVPLNTEPTLPPNPQKLIIAIGNFSYLATIGEFIKKRVSDAGYECQFVEKPAHEIQTLLDQASQES